MNRWLAAPAPRFPHAGEHRRCCNQLPPFPTRRVGFNISRELRRSRLLGTVAVLPHPCVKESACMIAPSPPLAGPPESEPTDPVVRRYRALFALLDWNLIPERAAGRPWPGRPPHPPAAYVKAL